MSFVGNGNTWNHWTGKSALQFLIKQGYSGLYGLEEMSPRGLISLASKVRTEIQLLKKFNKEV